jgi:hypothetical protein
MTIPFRPIAHLLASKLNPSPRIDMSAVKDLIPRIVQEGRNQGVLITVNHYFAPDFHAWWFVILISDIFPKHIHWVVTSGWTDSGWKTGFTHWLFPLGANLLGFTPMPAMPPDPSQAEARAVAVRKVLKYTRRTTQPVVGMAPEGRDIPGGLLGSLPAGVGRFMYLISQKCPIILPVGVWTEDGCINMKFGNPYQLTIPASLTSRELDNLVGKDIMRHIASCLPPGLRGEYQ